MYLRFSLLFLLITVISCNSERQLTRHNLALQYSPDYVPFMPDIAVLNLNDSTSRVYIRIKRIRDLYMKGKDSVSRAKFSVNLRFYKLPFDGRVHSEIKMSYHDSLPGSHPIFDSADVKLAIGANYSLLIDFSSENSNQRISFSRNITRQKGQAQQDYIILDAMNTPVFREYVKVGEYFKIRNASGIISTFEFERSLLPDAVPADPPFRPSLTNSTDDLMEKDSDIVENFWFESQEAVLASPGIYRLQKSEAVGFTLYCYNSYFPSLGGDAGSLGPLRYITSSTEFDALKQGSHSDASFEFWKSVTGNPDRAAFQMQRYTNRVEQANLLFSREQAGWSTDKGMIYIVYGPPAFVYVNNDIEEWTYGEESNPNSLRFYFSRQNGGRQSEDGRLVRMPECKNSWYLFVSNWRR